MVVLATLVAIGYADQGVAEDARKSIQELEDELTIGADHVAAISRDVEGRYHAHISHSAASAVGGVDCGPFWEVLFGVLFFIPVAGIPPTARSHVLRGHDTFRDQVRRQLKPGTSALFMVIERGALDKMADALARYGGTMIDTSLSKAEVEGLREMLRTPTSADASA
jgi:uncharacterized membrane protein